MTTNGCSHRRQRDTIRYYVPTKNSAKHYTGNTLDKMIETESNQASRSNNQFTTCTSRGTHQTGIQSARSRLSQTTASFFNNKNNKKFARGNKKSEKEMVEEPINFLACKFIYLIIFQKTG